MGKGGNNRNSNNAKPHENRNHNNAGKHQGGGGNGGNKRTNADLRKDMMAVATGGGAQPADPAQPTFTPKGKRRSPPSSQSQNTLSTAMKQLIGNLVADQIAKTTNKTKDASAEELKQIRKELTKDIEASVKSYIATLWREKSSSADFEGSAEEEIRQARSSLRHVMDTLRTFAHVRIESKTLGDGTVRERKFLSFATAKQGHAFAEFIMNFATRLSSVPTLGQRVKGCARIASENFPTVWQEIEAFATRLKDYKGAKNATPPEYELAGPDVYERIADFVAAFAVHHLRSVIPFGTILLALTLRDFELLCMPAAALRKMHEDPWACPSLTKIHSELHAYFVKEPPKQSTKHDLYAWKTTAFPESNIVQANLAKPATCPMHAANVKCDITFD